MTYSNYCNLILNPECSEMNSCISQEIEAIRPASLSESSALATTAMQLPLSSASSSSPTANSSLSYIASKLNPLILNFTCN